MLATADKPSASAGVRRIRLLDVLRGVAVFGFLAALTPCPCPIRRLYLGLVAPLLP
jgi:hypothetical protein